MSKDRENVENHKSWKADIVFFIEDTSNRKNNNFGLVWTGIFDVCFHQGKVSGYPDL